ncbi:capsular polysaccharide export protein, LipB/KpsS family [Mangrovicoccus ximenensis]|uniref:capsular polysaccharide export protein, LipB/KpsS family n=1 Tax=Mangrovicoccus ximenensis TaxID=1911570 RepID=UPI000D335AF2|nr:capsular biosynthesis protein [Mangrovicoccus ximenensis]
MFYYLKDGDPEIDGMMASVCAMGGKTACVSKVRWRFSDYPETAARAAESLKHAKHQSSSKHTRALKTALYSAQYNGFRRLFERDPEAVAVAWNGLTGTRRAFMSAAKDTGTPHIYMERAPLPGRVTVDETGVNQVNGLAREIGFYRDWADAENGHGGGWRALKDILVSRKAKKRSDVGQTDAAADLAAAPFVFCPLQVPDDTQIKMFGGWVRNINRFIDLLELAAEHLPEGWHLRFKEHPSSKIPLTEFLEQAAAAQPGKIVIDNSTDTFQQVAASRAVVTLNSSVGLQTFWYDKPVLVLGECFFRMPELVTPVESPTHLMRSFAAIEEAGFDPDARDVFMNYLDRVYYPEMIREDGKASVAPEKVLPKIEAALASRRR